MNYCIVLVLVILFFLGMSGDHNMSGLVQRKSRKDGENTIAHQPQPESLECAQNLLIVASLLNWLKCSPILQNSIESLITTVKAFAHQIFFRWTQMRGLTFMVYLSIGFVYLKLTLLIILLISCGEINFGISFLLLDVLLIASTSYMLIRVDNVGPVITSSTASKSKMPNSIRNRPTLKSFLHDKTISKIRLLH